MVQIGTISYEARVTGVADAKKQADELSESQRGVAAASEESAAATGFLAGQIGVLGSSHEDTGRETDRAKTKTDLFASSLFFLARAAGGALVAFLPFTGLLSKVAGGIATLSRFLIGSLIGGLSTVVGWLSSFASFLAAGSAGALAVAAAIGIAVGVFGVWILQITGVLDKIGQLGAWLRNRLPGWARDGILTIIGLFTGPLAAVGAFITGTLEGGFSEGFARARQVLQIFAGAFRRTFDRIAGFIIDLGSSAGSAFRNTFNALIPNRLNIPQVTIGGGTIAGQRIPSVTIGGGSLSLPQLQVGGMVRRTGAAIVDRGEAVLPPPLVDAARGQSTGGGTEVVIEGITVQIDAGDFDPTNMSRRELEAFAEDVAEMVGKETSRRAGVR